MSLNPYSQRGIDSISLGQAIKVATATLVLGGLLWAVASAFFTLSRDTTDNSGALAEIEARLDEIEDNEKRLTRVELILEIRDKREETTP